MNSIIVLLIIICFLLGAILALLMLTFVELRNLGREELVNPQEENEEGEMPTEIPATLVDLEKSKGFRTKEEISAAMNNSNSVWEEDELDAEEVERY